jgi:transcriptional/translational regulatory protein YebC/TACO1
MAPQNTMKVTGKDAELVLRLMETLEEHDDVQNVYSNFDIDEKELAAIQGS